MTLGFNSNSTLVWGWQPEPGSRGTWSIIASCLTTMSLCIWSALHLNMPAWGDSAWRIAWRKFLWLLCGLFAPELIVWTAYQQWRDARSLTPKMQKLLSQDPKAARPDGAAPTLSLDQETEDIEAAAKGTAKSPDNSRRYPWTIVHSHFVLMGGFAMDAWFSPEPYLPPGVTQLKLRPEAVLLVATLDPNLIPNISEEQITDKSKASSLAKTIVCLQASWFCVQCIGRLQQGIGVSLLELNTFAHAICALLIFLLWWNKPLDVDQAAVIQGERNPELCAAIVAEDAFKFKRPELLLKKNHTRNDIENLGHDTKIEAVLRKDDYRENSEPEEVAQVFPLENAIRIYLLQMLPRFYGIDLANAIIPVTDSVTQQERYELGYTGPLRLLRPSQKRIIDDSTYEWFSIGNIRGYATYEAIISTKAPSAKRSEIYANVRDKIILGLGSEDLRFLELADQGVKKYSSSLGLVKHGSAPTPCLARRIGDWPPLGSVNTNGIYLRSFSLLVGLMAAGLAYGGMHLLAWSAPFTSHAEAILWRSSAIVLITSGLGFGLTKFFSEEKGINLNGTFFGDMFKGLVYAVCLVFLLLYVAARIFLVVECFLELQHLPKEVYLTPKWTKYWPHIG